MTSLNKFQQKLLHQTENRTYDAVSAASDTLLPRGALILGGLSATTDVEPSGQMWG